jgi:hypothetical protein
MATHLDVMPLNQLCGMMHKQGYQFASLYVNPPTSLAASRLDELILMEDGPKPMPAWHFSEIEWSDLDEQWTLSWAEWCKYENFQVAEYASTLYLPIRYFFKLVEHFGSVG